MKKFDTFLEEQMKDSDFKNEFENLQPELDVIRAIVDARTSQNLTQKQLSERTGINQADISKLENGTRNPTLNMLKRLAKGMNMELKIEFTPKQAWGEGYLAFSSKKSSASLSAKLGLISGKCFTSSSLI